jgi:hypothetical protein
MAAPKPRPTSADYVAIALSPALLMTLIGSLIYFLIEVLYRGEYEGRLQWILGFYIFGSVLVARVSMETGIADRAPLYALVLAALTVIGLGQFVAFPPGFEGLSWVINSLLVALIWWSAHRLTYDCTYIDEKAEGTGTGVLQAAGLDQAAEGTTPEPATSEKKRLGWWERWQRYREERKKRHTPGVWVVYFTLASLPIFGLGQSLIPSDEVERRRYTFWLMGIYVVSALGLLLTTAFLALRRYLRQRRLEMPIGMTTAWLTCGGVLIVVLVVLGALLPRPEAEYSLLDLTPLGSKKRDASQYAMKGGDAGKGQGRPGQQQLDKDGKPVNTNDPKQKGDGGKGQAQGKGDGEKGKSGDDGKGKGNEKSKSGDQKSEPGKNQDAQADKKDNGERDNADSKDSQAKKQSDSGGNSSTSKPPLSSLPVLNRIGPIVKWIIFGVLAVLAVVFLLRGGLRYLANFFDWARRLLDALRAFWEGLFSGRKREVATAGAGEESGEERRPLRPFQWYRNPFRDGRAADLPPGELVRYSFEALEAWAAEHGLPRMADETPLEFAGRVGREVPAIEAEAKRLAALYARVLYAKGTLPGSWRGALEKFWERLEAVAEAPLSA